MMAYLRERPTREQWQVAAWMFIVVLAVMGSVGLWCGFRAPAEHRDIAQQLIRIGEWSWIAAVAVWGFKRGVEWFVD
jgi:hypothetical protein